MKTILIHLINTEKETSGHPFVDPMRAGEAELADAVCEIDIENPARLREASSRATKVLLSKEIPWEVRKEISHAYRKLQEQEPLSTSVAVRSSATAEDWPAASFAGQMVTHLNVKEHKALLQAVRDCWASLFSERAILYREKLRIGHTDVSMAVLVQSMIEAEKAGVAFTIDPITADDSVVLIEAALGLGQAIVEGRVDPDTYVVDKRTLRVVEERVQPKRIMIIPAPGGTGGTIEVGVPKELQEQPCLRLRELKRIASLSCKIEEGFGTPQDVEWAIAHGEVFILQTRPTTTLQATEHP